jgi:hypothetical protein
MTRSVERLEYGKLCRSVRGPILSNAEVGLLAASPGFPEELKPLCRPATWRLGEAEIETCRTLGSTVVVLNTRVRGDFAVVGARFRRRPEDGEGAQGRDFWRARFLCGAPTEVGAAELGMALTGERLEGWVLHAQADVWDIDAPGVGAAEGPLPSEGELEQFVDRALTAIAHGLRVGMRHAPPAVFWRFAHAVERALSPRTRAVFGAGWGVTPTLAAQLLLASSQEFSFDTAVYDTGSRQWLAGPEEAGPSRERAGADLADSSDHGSASRLFFLSDTTVQQALRADRRASLAARRLEVVVRWLESALPGAAVPASVLEASDAGELKRLSELALEAMQKGSRAFAGEALLVALLTGPRAREIRQLFQGIKVTPTVALICALSAGNLAGALTELPRLGGDCLPWARERLERELARPEAFDQALASLHAAMLNEMNELPEVYRAWALGNAGRLALVLAAFATEPDRRGALRILESSVTEVDLSAIVHVLYGDPDEASLVPEFWVAPLTLLALRRWRARGEGARVEKTAALRWLRRLGYAGDEPLLRAGRPTAEELVALAQADPEELPIELLDSLASRILEFWPAFGPCITPRIAIWRAIFERWPAAVVGLLAPDALSLLSEPRVESVSLPSIQLRPEDLEEIGREFAWCGAGASGTGRESTSIFIGWCAQFAGEARPGSLVETVGWLWRGEDSRERGVDEPPQETPKIRGEVCPAIKTLLRAAPLDEAAVKERWRTADAGRLLLLAELFGNPGDQVRVESLEKLLGRKDELKEVLRSGRGPGQHGWGLLAEEWQSIDRGKYPREWRPEYAGTLLTGLFSGLQASEEASLAKLLAFFSVRDRKNKAVLALAYWDRRGPMREGDETGERIWTEFIVPTCEQAGLEPERFRELITYSPYAHRRHSRIQPYEWVRDPIEIEGHVINVHPDLLQLVQVLREEAQDDRRLRAYQNCYRKRQLAGVGSG